MSKQNKTQLAKEPQKKRPRTREQIASRVTLRPQEFADAIGMCRASVYKLMAEGKIKSVKTGESRRSARLITTTPEEFKASLEDGV